jgi:hypothetical protein
VGSRARCGRERAPRAQAPAAPRRGRAYEALGRLDGYIPAEHDVADARRHDAQRTGVFLIDRDGIVRWANIECARHDLAGINQMPSDEELVAAARAL